MLDVLNARKGLQVSVAQRARAHPNAPRVEQMEPLNCREGTDEWCVEEERSSWRPLVGNTEIKVSRVSQCRLKQGAHIAVTVLKLFNPWNICFNHFFYVEHISERIKC
jgi:hypothetical protein